MKLNQKYSICINWITWIVRFLLHAVAGYQINLGKIQTWTILNIAFLSMLNVDLPLLSGTFKFQQILELHDRNARAYTIIKTDLLSNKITLDEAIKQFIDIYKRSPEKINSQTPLLKDLGSYMMTTIVCRNITQNKRFFLEIFCDIGRSHPNFCFAKAYFSWELI